LASIIAMAAVIMSTTPIGRAPLRTSFAILCRL
jgi:hypothetical protein